MNTHQVDLAQNAASTQTTINIKNEALESFTSSLVTFIQALTKKFKKCTKIKEAYQKFNIMYIQITNDNIKQKMSQKLVSEWYKVFHPYFADVQEGKFSVVDRVNHPLLNELELREKFKASKISTRQIIMQHILTITNNAEMYFCSRTVEDTINPSLLNKIKDMTLNIQASSGGNINYSNIIQMSQELVKTLSPNEVQNLQSLGKNGNILSLLNNIMLKNQ